MRQLTERASVSGPCVKTRVFFCVDKIINAEMWPSKNDYN